jgi:putative iron-regulated protein
LLQVLQQPCCPTPLVLAAPSASDVAPVLAHCANIVHTNYQDTLETARMWRAINTFLARPSAKPLQEAQKASRETREPYGQTEAYRFYGGPIDDDDGPEGRTNSWPMDESDVDEFRT